MLEHDLKQVDMLDPYTHTQTHTHTHTDLLTYFIISVFHTVCV